MNDYIAENITNIQGRISAAARRSGRSPGDITVIGVTKTVETEKIKKMLDCGITSAGENKVQELCEKYPVLDGVSWHMIGHLQTNKVKQVVGKVCLIQSLDSLRLAEEINKQASAKGIVCDVLVEINIANEDRKFGVTPDNALKFTNELNRYNSLSARGIMCVAPFVENPPDNRYYFRKMYKLFVDMKANLSNNTDIQYLSMGMTQDYEVAVEEGSNMIRIGTGIFGAR